MNQLKDWTSTPDTDETASVIARAEEQRHAENTIPRALGNINKSQTRQRVQQNRGMNVEEDLLTIGNKVFVRIEARGDKLQPRFSVRSQ